VLASKSRNGLAKQTPEALPIDCRSIAPLIFMAQLRARIRYMLQRFAEGGDLRRDGASRERVRMNRNPFTLLRHRCIRRNTTKPKFDSPIGIRAPIGAPTTGLEA
jgi:hypothetical protein